MLQQATRRTVFLAISLRAVKLSDMFLLYSDKCNSLQAVQLYNEEKHEYSIRRCFQQDQIRTWVLFKRRQWLLH